MKNLLRKLSDNGIIYPLIFELAWGIILLVCIFLKLFLDDNYEDAFEFLAITGLIIGVGVVILSFVVVSKLPFKRAVPTMVFWTIEFIITLIFLFNSNAWIVILSYLVIPPFAALGYFSLFGCLGLIGIPFIKLIIKKDNINEKQP